jgi:hypothetical protein
VLPPVTVNPHSASDATSGAGGIGSTSYAFGANPNTGFLGGGSGFSPVVLIVGAIIGAGFLYLLMRRG